MATTKTVNKMAIAQEIVTLMTRKGTFAGLWTGQPMTAEAVISYVEKNGFLPLASGHTKNSLQMQNVRKQISRRVALLKK